MRAAFYCNELDRVERQNPVRVEMNRTGVLGHGSCANVYSYEAEFPAGLDGKSATLTVPCAYKVYKEDSDTVGLMERNAIHNGELIPGMPLGGVVHKRYQSVFNAGLSTMSFYLLDADGQGFLMPDLNREGDVAFSNCESISDAFPKARRVQKLEELVSGMVSTGIEAALKGISLPYDSFFLVAREEDEGLEVCHIVGDFDGIDLERGDVEDNLHGVAQILAYFLGQYSPDLKDIIISELKRRGIQENRVLRYIFWHSAGCSI